MTATLLKKDKKANPVARRLRLGKSPSERKNEAYLMGTEAGNPGESAGEALVMTTTRWAAGNQNLYRSSRFNGDVGEPIWCLKIQPEGWEATENVNPLRLSRLSGEAGGGSW